MAKRFLANNVHSFQDQSFNRLAWRARIMRLIPIVIAALAVMTAGCAPESTLRSYTSECLSHETLFAESPRHVRYLVELGDLDPRLPRSNVAYLERVGEGDDEITLVAKICGYCSPLVKVYGVLDRHSAKMGFIYRKVTCPEFEDAIRITWEREHPGSTLAFE